MDLKDDVKVTYENGVAKISAFEGGVELLIKAALLVKPALLSLEADIESGKIDLIKDTDIDKTALLALVAGIKKAVGV